MKKRNPVFVARESVRNLVGTVLILAALAFSSMLSAQELYGPENPPPKGASITFSGSLNDGLIGRPGGKLYNITGVNLSATTTVYWAMVPGSIKLSLDGSTYTEAEILDYNASLSNLDGGIVVWTGSTYIPIANDNGVGIAFMKPLLSKFVITVSYGGGGAVALEDPTGLGVDAEAGGMLNIPSPAILFVIRMEMFVSEDNGVTWVPHLTYYDAQQTPAGGLTAYSSYEYGFWWENDPPVIENLNEVPVDEGDTVVITSPYLLATDVESSTAELQYTIDPKNTALLPANGSILIDELPPPAKGTVFTQEMLSAGLVSYLHNGSETLEDSIALMLVDSDGAKALVDGDTVFYLKFVITPVDDPPQLVSNTGGELDEGGVLVLSSEMLEASDPESGPEGIVFSLDPFSESDYPLHGMLLKNAIPMSDGSTFTQEDINNGLITYQHDGSESLSDGFQFTVADEYGHPASIGEQTDFFFAITISPVNDPPVFYTLESLPVDEGAIGYITSAYLAVTDTDNPDNEIIFTVDPDHNVLNPEHGVLKLGATELSDGGTFTMSDVNNNLLSYTHDGSEISSDFFAFSVADADGGQIRDGDFTVFHFGFTINQVNDPPVLAAAIIDQKVNAASPFSFTVPEETFTDPDPDDVLSWDAFGLDEASLPSWLTFSSGSRAFSGTPARSDMGDLYIIVEVSDLELASARDTFVIKIDYPVGLTEKGADNDMLIYPNPATAKIYVQMPSDLKGELTLRIYNLLGEEVLQQQFIDLDGEELSIDISKLAPGIYMLKAGAAEREITRKLVIK